MAKKSVVYEAVDEVGLPPPRQTTLREALPRTHKVMGNLLHSDSLTKGQALLLTAGDTVTFAPEIEDEEIQALLDIGILDGPVAREQIRDRLVEEAKSGMEGMTPDELANIWRGFLRQNAATRRRNERGEARIQEDGNAARLANITDDQANDPLTRAPADIA